MQRNKKSRQEIENAIISALNKKPLSTQELSREIKSNWSTVEETLNELIQDKRVRELVSTEKLKIYSIKDSPVFYSIPLDEQIVDDSIILMNLIVKEWENTRKSFPPLTTLQKIAVDVVNEKDCDLHLPVVNFHYGKVIPVIYNSGRIEITEEIIKKYSKTLSIIKRVIVKHTEIAWKERAMQYKKYNMGLFQIKENIQFAFNKENVNKKDLENNILDFSIKYPIYDEEVYDLMSKFESSSVLLLGIKWTKDKEKDYLHAIQNSFEKIWDLTTTWMFFKEIRKFVNPENFSLLNLIKDMQINSKINAAESSLLELESFTDTIKAEDIPIIDNAEAKEAFNILLEGIEEE